MNQTLTLYKLMILEMLNEVNFPLTNSQITEFLVKYNYATYFEVQQSFSELSASSLILEKKIHHSTRYGITEDGIQTLTYYQHMMPDSFIENIQTYIHENKIELRNRVSAISEYTPAENGEYAVRCKILEQDGPIFHMTLYAPTKELAEQMCFNWEKKQSALYAHILQELIENNAQNYMDTRKIPN